MSDIEVVRERIDEFKVRYPLYSYETGKSMYLSKRETVLIDTWTKTFNYTECRKMISRVNGKELDIQTIKRWIRKPRIQVMIMERLRDKGKADGYNREKWISEGRDIKEGLVKVSDQQMMAWKEMGKALGYYVEERGLGTAVQINFTQGNGEI